MKMFRSEGVMKMDLLNVVLQRRERIVNFPLHIKMSPIMVALWIQSNPVKGGVQQKLIAMESISMVLAITDSARMTVPNTMVEVKVIIQQNYGQHLKLGNVCYLYEFRIGPKSLPNLFRFAYLNGVQTFLKKIKFIL